MSELEKTIEKRFCDRVKREGGVPYKFTSPARRNVPDRLVLYPIPEIDRGTVGKYVKFIELKATGKGPTAGQAREHKRLRDLGFIVEVVDK